MPRQSRFSTGNQLQRAPTASTLGGFTMSLAIHEVRMRGRRLCAFICNTPRRTACVGQSSMRRIAAAQPDRAVWSPSISPITIMRANRARPYDERPRPSKGSQATRTTCCCLQITATADGLGPLGRVRLRAHVPPGGCACTMAGANPAYSDPWPPTPSIRRLVDKNTSLLANPERQELRSTTLVWPALLRASSIASIRATRIEFFHNYSVISRS